MAVGSVPAWIARHQDVGIIGSPLPLPLQPSRGPGPLRPHLVRITLDGHMQVGEVRILDESLPAETRQQLKQAFAKAMQAAQAAQP